MRGLGTAQGPVPVMTSWGQTCGTAPQGRTGGTLPPLAGEGHGALQMTMTPGGEEQEGVEEEEHMAEAGTSPPATESMNQARNQSDALIASR